MTNNNDVENIISNYDYIIDVIVNYIKSIGFNDPISIYKFIGGLINNGFLSFDREDHEVPCLSVENLLNDSLTLNAHGVCRHYSPFLQKCYTRLGYESDVYCGLLRDKNYKSNNEIIKHLSKHIKIKEPVPFKKYIEGNHMITRVKDKEGKLAYVDASLLKVYYPSNFNTVSSIDYDFSCLPILNSKYNHDIGLKVMKIKDVYTEEEVMSILRSYVLYGFESESLYMDLYKKIYDKLVESEESYQRIKKQES